MLIDLIKNSASPKEVIYKLLIYIFALALAFSIHEFMHAAVAVWLGDNTPKNMGRLTLNPIAHVDPVGTILLLIAAKRRPRPQPQSIPTNSKAGLPKSAKFQVKRPTRRPTPKLPLIINSHGRLTANHTRMKRFPSAWK